MQVTKNSDEKRKDEKITTHSDENLLARSDRLHELREEARDAADGGGEVHRVEEKGEQRARRELPTLHEVAADDEHANHGEHEEPASPIPLTTSMILR